MNGERERELERGRAGESLVEIEDWHTPASSTVDGVTLEAILISMGGGAWCAMMAVTPESRGLNSPRSEDQWGNLPCHGLKASVVAAPLLSRHPRATFRHVNGRNMIIRETFAYL